QQQQQGAPPTTEQPTDSISPKDLLTPFKNNGTSSVWNSTPPSGCLTDIDPILLDETLNSNIDDPLSQVSSIPVSGAPNDCPPFPDWENWITTIGTTSGGEGDETVLANPFDTDFNFLGSSVDDVLKSLAMNDVPNGDDSMINESSTLFDDFLTLPNASSAEDLAATATGFEKGGLPDLGVSSLDAILGEAAGDAAAASAAGGAAAVTATITTPVAADVAPADTTTATATATASNVESTGASAESATVTHSAPTAAQ
ncbi:hypothetical protein KEM56_000393, partial [Ascosphaera pollenicola]